MCTVHVYKYISFIHIKECSAAQAEVDVPWRANCKINCSCQIPSKGCILLLLLFIDCLTFIHTL